MKKGTNIFAILIGFSLLTFIFCYSLIATTLSATVSSSIEQTLTETLDHYFSHRNGDYLDSDHSSINTNNALYEEDMVKAIASRTADVALYVEGIKSIGWKIFDCQTDYYINNITLSGNKLIAEVYESVSITFLNRLKEFSPAYHGIFHKITFQINNNSLILLEDIYTDTAVMTSTGDAYFTSQGLLSYINEKTIEFIDPIVVSIDNDEHISINSITSDVSNYSPILASAYAQEYANSTTPPAPYVYYSADCANFASQCLHQGGLQISSTWYNKSDVWISSTKLRNYLKNLSGTTYSNSPLLSNVAVGDIIFYDWYKDGCSCTCTMCTTGKCESCAATVKCSGRTYNHTAICSKIGSDGTPYICQHSSSVNYNDPLVFYSNGTSFYSLVKMHNNHILTNKYNDFSHWTECTKCGHRNTSTNHTYSSILSITATSHIYSCTGCDYTLAESHNFYGGSCTVCGVSQSYALRLLEMEMRG